MMRLARQSGVLIVFSVIAAAIVLPLVLIQASPIAVLRLLVHEFRVQTIQSFSVTPAVYQTTDVGKLMSITTIDDVAAARQRLLGAVWGAPALPGGFPAEVRRGIADDRFDDERALARIDELRIRMDHGLESRVYHFVPLAPASTVVLFHEGHDGDFFHSRKQIRALLSAGYSVLAFAMPLLGMNNQPVVELPRFGRVTLSSHEQMRLLQPAAGHPVQYFLEPVVKALNYLARDYNYTSVNMTGISGGGWTTTMAAAVDPRIQRSFPVAGSLPFYLRAGVPGDWGDFEQTAVEIYREVNYLELYLLGAAGKGRKQLQILNQYDPCCFAGTKSETYAAIVMRRVQSLGAGGYDLFLDRSHKAHAISDAAMTRIMTEIERKDP